MEYIPDLNKILVINSVKIIIADPFTFKSLSELSVEQSINVVMVTGTKYAIITMY